MTAGRIGYQADGSYEPCPDCGHVPATVNDPPWAVSLSVLPRTPGTAIHKGDCPRVALPRDVAEKLHADLAEMDRVRRRGAAEAAHYVIG